MGSACCVAAREPKSKESPTESLQRHDRRSPSWSFRRDNRVRVAIEAPSGEWVHDGEGASHLLDAKSGTTVGIGSPSEGASPLESFRSLVWQKSSVSEGNSGILRHPSSDPSISHTSEAVCGKLLVKESTGSPACSYSSVSKPSPSTPSLLSLSTSPLSSQNHHLQRNSTQPRWHHRSPRHLSISDEQSTLLLPAWGSNDGSSNSWSSPALADRSRTRRHRWSFDSQQTTRSPTLDLQTCGVCTRHLATRSSWDSQNIIATTEIDVVAVLICGHVFHAGCLECMTPEINKYDPICPACTLGEKISKKALKAEINVKARKQSRNRVVDSNLNEFDHGSNGHEGTIPELSLSSSMKSSSLGKRFFGRHFSFGSKGITSFLEDHPARKRGFFWTRSSKV